jgi:hypothetical protein
LEGHTPLQVAIIKRHWETAQLLLAICATQYKPEEKKLGRFENVTEDSDGMSSNHRYKFSLIIGADEDEDINMDSDSDGTAEPIENKFTDLASAPTPVQSVVNPLSFLSMDVRWAGQGKYIKNTSPFVKVSPTQRSKCRCAEPTG